MTKSDRLKIAYLCDQSPFNPLLYSGGNARIFNALQEHVGEVTVLGQSWHLAEPIRRCVAALPESLHLRSRWRVHYALASVIARGVERELAKGEFDVLFGAYSLQSMARVSPAPSMLRVFTSDATQTTYRDSEIGASFGSYWSASRALDGWVKRCEAQTLQNLDLMLWPSEWLHERTHQTYGLDKARMAVVPWGAGVEAWPEPGNPGPFGVDHPLHLLVVGRDWFAKGGPVAFDTMKALRTKGLDARLSVIGCTPPDWHQNEHVTVYPSLNKSDPEEMKTFSKVFGSAHFLIMPSHESYGFAFCEGSAYGVPSLCLRVGGVPIRDGINGFALSPSSGVPEFSAQIQSLLADPSRYEALRASTRTEFETRLNWDSWGQEAARLIHAALHAKRKDKNWA